MSAETQGVDRAHLASAGGDEGGPRSGGCADHGGRCGSECAPEPAEAAPGRASGEVLQASRPISRGSLLDSSVAAQHRLEIGICAVERPDGEEILQVCIPDAATPLAEAALGGAEAVSRTLLILGSVRTPMSATCMTIHAG